MKKLVMSSNFTNIPQDFTSRSSLKPVPKFVLEILERRAHDNPDIKFFNSRLLLELNSLLYKDVNVKKNKVCQRTMNTALKTLEDLGFISRLCERFQHPTKGRVATVRIIRVNTIAQLTGGHFVKDSRFTGHDPRTQKLMNPSGIIEKYDFSPLKYKEQQTKLIKEDTKQTHLSGIAVNKTLANFQEDERMIHSNSYWIETPRTKKSSFLRVVGDKKRTQELTNYYQRPEVAAKRKEKAEKIAKFKEARKGLENNGLRVVHGQGDGFRKGLAEAALKYSPQNKAEVKAVEIPVKRITLLDAAALYKAEGGKKVVVSENPCENDEFQLTAQKFALVMFNLEKKGIESMSVVGGEYTVQDFQGAETESQARGRRLANLPISASLRAEAMDTTDYNGDFLKSLNVSEVK
jgi:hypothetical protein